MKKIFIALTLIFAFSFNASAQKMTAPKAEKQEKVSAEVAAKNDAKQLSEYLGLDATMTEDFYRLFELKYKTLENDLSVERKTELTRVIEAKIRATIGDEKMAKLEKNQELLKKLISIQSN